MMRFKSLLIPGVMSLFPLCVSAVPFADQVLDFNPGVGGAPGYQNPDRALGEPSRTTPFGPVDAEVSPFNPPWPSSQLVSIGKGGSITLRLGEAATDAPSHAFGVDLIVFGNNGLIVTDYTVPESQWTTDGSLFNFDPPGHSRVWVSENNIDYFELIAPAGAASSVDGYFPTDGKGDFLKAMDPNLDLGKLNGLTLDGLRAVYAGSAGGTGLDLAWARLADGRSAGLSSAQYLRIDVLDGKVEIDGLAVVPEPTLFGLGLVAGAAFLMLRPLRRQTGTTIQ